ncbi:MAG: lipoate--protein ligase [Candidatus Nezhaarchaeales archaeon]
MHKIFSRSLRRPISLSSRGHRQREVVIDEMETWRLLDLGFAEPIKAQTFFEAVAMAVDRGLSPSTLILVLPSRPYVCIGYHQELEKEVDVEFCRSRGLEIYRRIIGGGAVYLNNNQLFYQLVAHEDSPHTPKTVEDLFRVMVPAIVNAYKELGVKASYKPINDVVVDGKKIAGTGAGRLGKAVMFVGNIIFDLDYDLMTRVLKVPNEKFRDKLAKTMRDWVTTLRRELPQLPDLEYVKKAVIKSFEEALGVKFELGEPTRDEIDIWEEEVKPRHTSDEWLRMFEDKRSDMERIVKVAHDVKVIEIAHKASKMIRITAVVKGNEIIDIMITGDFFAISEDSIRELERKLKGLRPEEKELSLAIQNSLEKAQIPGLTVKDFVDAIMKIKASI